MRLVQDPYNGERWQWKYFQSRPGFVNRWFDFGPVHASRTAAIRWMEAR